MTEARIMGTQVARELLAAVPDRTQLSLASATGKTRGQPWRVDVLPFPTGNVEGQVVPLWMPLAISVTVQSFGRDIHVSTIRLQKRSPK